MYQQRFEFYDVFFCLLFVVTNKKGIESSKKKISLISLFISPFKKILKRKANAFELLVRTSLRA